MIINLFRKLLVGLSFYYKNNLELVKKKDKIILKNIHSRLGKLSKKNQKSRNARRRSGKSHPKPLGPYK